MALSNFGFPNSRRWRRRRGLAGSAPELDVDCADVREGQGLIPDDAIADTQSDDEAELRKQDQDNGQPAAADARIADSANEVPSNAPGFGECAADPKNLPDGEMPPESEWCYDQNEWQPYLSQEAKTTDPDDAEIDLLEEHTAQDAQPLKSSNMSADQETSPHQTHDTSSETARSRFFTDEDHVIEGQPAVPAARIYASMPEGLLDSAAAEIEDDDSQLKQSSVPRAGENTDMQSENSDTEEVTTGALMNDNADSNGSQQELAAPSRMERLHPKSANSLTGAPPPKVDGRVEDSVLSPESEVLLVVLHAPERNTFRTYLRRHDIPCRAAISAENAVAIVLEMKPAMILISGSGMNPEEILTLVDDLNDMVDAPVLTLLTESQIKLLSNDPLNSHVLQYPASLRHIRSELTRILLAEGNAKPRCSLRSALMQD